MTAARTPLAVVWAGDRVRLLDQTRLPHEEVYLDCLAIEDVFAAICKLSVRGAPAIGIAAAYGLVLQLEETMDAGANLAVLAERARYLRSARPTAVNLAWAVERMVRCAERSVGGSVGLRQALLTEAVAIHTEDVAACRRIGEAGLPLVTARPRLLTHCNAGSLATSEMGTALAPIYLAHRQGVAVHVYVDETRPLLQGARLTAYELQRAGVPMTLIADNMAAHVMALGKVEAVIVGADRVAANGDVANKIGTLNLAILCQYFRIPFFVACPLSTIDLAIADGSHIPVEERSGEEVLSLAGRRLAPPATPVFNPAFDITPADLVSAIITDRGVLWPPFAPGLAAAGGEHDP